MTVIVARTNPDPSYSTEVFDAADRISSGLICGEDLRACAPCYIAADGMVYMCGGSGVTAVGNPGASCIGWTTRKTRASQGDPITLVEGIDFGYSSGMTPGKNYYIDCTTTTKGRIGDVQPFPGCPPCAYSLDATRIRVMTALSFPVA